MSNAQPNDDLTAEAAAYVDLLPDPWRARLTAYRPASEWRATAAPRICSSPACSIRRTPAPGRH